MSGRDLEDEIIQLQKLQLVPQIAGVVEQAQQAFAVGRELEAEALVEKAAALVRVQVELAS
jgi:hypothetical protein